LSMLLEPDAIAVSILDVCGGSPLTLNASRTSTIGHLKELVSERWGVEYCEQKIACGHEVPADEASLASLYTGAEPLMLTMVLVPSPEVQDARMRLMGNSSEDKSHACIVFAKSFWSSSEKVSERRRAVAYKLGVHQDIINMLGSCYKDCVRQHGCAALAHMCKAEGIHAGSGEAVELRRSGAAEAGAIEVLVPIICDPDCNVFAKEAACTCLARICQATDSVDGRHSAEQRRRRAVLAGAVEAVVAMVKRPCTFPVRMEALAALNEVVGQDSGRRAAALKAGAEEQWLTDY
jgi:hypothetical protein